MCLLIFCDQPCPPCVPDLIIYFRLSDLTQFVCACKNIVCLQANLCALVQLCAQICPACSPDSIDTLISLIKCTQVQSMHVCYLVCLGQIMYSGRSTCSPGSIDTFISLIWPNLAKIWACACKNIACLHASLCALVKMCVQTYLAWSSDSIDTLIFLIWPNLAKIWTCVTGILHAG